MIRKTGIIKLSSTDQSKPDYAQNFVQKAILTNRMQRFGPVNESSSTSTVMKPKYSPKPSCSFWPDPKYTWSRKDQHDSASIAPISSITPTSSQRYHTTSVCSTASSVLEQAAPTNICSSQIAHASFSDKSRSGTFVAIFTQQTPTIKCCCFCRSCCSCSDICIYITNTRTIPFLTLLL